LTDLFGIAKSQPTDAHAATVALHNCQQQLKQMSESGNLVCEVIRLNDDEITTAADIRAGVGAQAHPLYLWEYQSTSSKVYLAGSIHVLKASLYPLPPQLEQAFQKSSILGLEVDSEKYPVAEVQRKMLDYALLPDGKTLKQVLPGDLLQRLNSELEELGISPQHVAQYKPSMIMNQLVVLRLQALGYLPQHGLEQHFRSKLGTKTIIELESIDAQLELLFNQPLDVQIQLLDEALAMDEDLEPLLADMLTAWLAGDDDALLEFIQDQSGESELTRSFNVELLDRRNVQMVETIKQYLETPGTYFILVGAAHFIGDNGIISLLEKQGITGTRVMSNDQI
jgi:uncharacterized protein YbaP (TraB family)